MGYTTTFTGRFEFSRELTISEFNEIKAFVEDRHDHEDVPSIHCDWTTDGKTLFWNGREKSYEMDSWLEYLINRFFSRYDVTLSGVVDAQGQSHGDTWRLKVEDSRVTKIKGRLVFEEDGG